MYFLMIGYYLYLRVWWGMVSQDVAVQSRAVLLARRTLAECRSDKPNVAVAHDRVRRDAKSGETHFHRSFAHRAAIFVAGRG